MYQDLCSGSISAPYALRYARERLALDDVQAAVLSQPSAFSSSIKTSCPMPTPPQTPPLFGHSSNVAQCASAELVPFHPPDVIARPETVRKHFQSSRTSAPKRKHDEAHVRRPANPFILFACEFRKAFEGQKKDNRDLSRRAGALWKTLSDSEKAIWKARAAAVKEKHAEDHPGYRYQPRRRETRQSQSDSPNQIGATTVILPPTPLSRPRKSADDRRRTTHGLQASRETEDRGVDSSILNSPAHNVFASKFDANPRSFTELLDRTPPGKDELTPSHSARSQHESIVPEAGPSSAAVQHSSGTSDAIDSHVVGPRMNCITQKWNVEPSYIPSVVDWNQIAPGVGGDVSRLQNLTADKDDDLYSTCYGQLTFAGPDGAASNALTSFIQTFLGNNGSL